MYVYICICTHTYTQNPGRSKTSPFQDSRSPLGLHLFLEKLSLNETT